MDEHVVFIPGVGGAEWLWAPQISALSDVATSEVVVLDRQVTRAEMAGYVLGRVPGGRPRRPATCRSGVPPSSPRPHG
jgi:hypothetical protein